MSSSPENFKTAAITNKLQGLLSVPYRTMIIVLSTSLLLTSCDVNKKSGEPSTPQVQILENEVIVDRDFILSSNPERYQPSYNLEGILVPIQKTTMSLPFKSHVDKVFVETGTWVNENQPLVQLSAYIGTKDLQNLQSMESYDYIDIFLDEDLKDNDFNNFIIEDNPTALERLQLKIKEATGMSSDDNDSTDETTDSKNTNAKNNNTIDNNKSTTSPSASASASASTENIDSDNKNAQTNTQPALSTVTKHNDGKVLVTLLIKAPIEGMVSKPDKSADSQAKAVNSSLNSNDTEGNTAQAGSTSFSEPQTNKLSFISKGAELTAKTPFLNIANTKTLQLIGKLPLETASQLSVGNPVDFSVFDLHSKFSGQIGRISPYPDQDYVVVEAPVTPDEKNEDALKPGMQAAMTIEYGQIQLGVRLPKQALHEVNIDGLSAKHPRPISPIKGYVWVVEQDEHLSYTPIEVVEYFPETKQYLVHGISNDSLVCIADLPKDSDGKKISID